MLSRPMLAFAVLTAGAAPLSARQFTPQTPAAPVAADTVRAGRFDSGRMWTFEYPPLAYFRTTYGIAADSAWFRKARLGALRIPGCSASLVSARGLVMTNHHCGRDATVAVTKPGENLLDNGFYAATEADERKAEAMYADQLIAIEDITEAMDKAERGAGDPSAVEDARTAAGEKAKERIAKQYGGEAKGIEVEVVSLWNGAKTSAYVFHRYKDVRLVMAPELQIGYFGGDPDNFTYPRYNLDMTFFRLYGADGKPLSTPEHFEISTKGVSPGDAVFVIGNPGSTSRLQTVAELQFRGDVQDASILALLDSRVNAYQEYVDDHKDAPEEVKNELFSLLNSQKAYTGIVKGLRDPYLIARRTASQRAFTDSIQATAELKADYGDLIDRMAKLQARQRDLKSEVRAFVGLGNPSLDGAALTRGLYAGQYLQGKSRGAPDEALQGAKEAMLGVGSQPAALQEALIAARLRDIQGALGNNAETEAILEGRSPEVAAAAVVQGSPLADSAKAVKALEDGSLTMNDPAIKLARAIIQRYSPYQSGIGPIQQEEEAIARKLGRARFAVYGVEVPPDATFSLRIADGVVKGYEYNGTLAPPRTTFYGLYDRYYSHLGGEQADQWALPKRWLDRKGSVDLSVPVDFVSTPDIIGGNSGSPIVDKDLRVVGLVFDGNIESLSGEFIYTEDTARTVSVDIRGIVEALKSVYQADRLVRELTGSTAATPARR